MDDRQDFLPVLIENVGAVVDVRRFSRSGAYRRLFRGVRGCKLEPGLKIRREVKKGARRTSAASVYHSDALPFLEQQPGGGASHGSRSEYHVKARLCAAATMLAYSRHVNPPMLAVPIFYS